MVHDVWGQFCKSGAATADKSYEGNMNIEFSISSIEGVLEHDGNFVVSSQIKRNGIQIIWDPK